MTATTSDTVSNSNSFRLVYNKRMAKLIEIITPIYQELVKQCERRKISVNLDIQDLTFRIDKPEYVKDFYTTEIHRALKQCEAGDKITISQSNNRFSVRNSAKTPLDTATIDKLHTCGYEVRARYGYDTIVTLTV